MALTARKDERGKVDRGTKAAGMPEEQTRRPVSAWFKQLREETIMERAKGGYQRRPAQLNEFERPKEWRLPYVQLFMTVRR